MKRHLTLIFFVLSLIIMLIGFRSNVRWSGIATWGLILICLTLATYFTKHIPNQKDK